MVRVLIGDMFQSHAQTWVNTVNTVGVMGKGIALDFRKRFPDMYQDYVERCSRGEVRLGRPYLYKRRELPWILNFPTKEHWRSPSSLDAIVQGLRYLADHCKEWGITSLAVPPLGSGQGRLEWRVVGLTLYRHLAALDIPVELYAPFGTPHEELQPSYLDRPTVDMAEATPDSIGPAWIALVEILSRLYAKRYFRPVGRVAFQKLAYFATEAGLPTGLEFERLSYGPFAKTLNRSVAKLLNNGLIREDQLGRMFALRPGPTFGDARVAYRDQLDQWTTAIDDLVDFFARIRTTREAELAATVDFAARQLEQKQGRVPTEREVLQAVRSWKKSIDPQEVALTIRSLGVLGRLKLRPSADLPIDELELIGAASN